MNIYNIPAGIPFARVLAAELLRRAGDSPHELPQTRILLPTRRACRTLRDAFLDITGGKPLLLPRMQPLGDVDEEELSLTLTGPEAEALRAIPPAIAPLQRQMLLARLVMGADGFSHGPAHALQLAQALARLIDRIHTEGLRMEDLPLLVPEDFAAHWQVTLKFLSVISHAWPAVLRSMGMVDGAQRRSIMMDALAAHWQSSPPASPVIAAGSTGSIPATARLLRVIAGLPQGAVILPGLDEHIDDESWDAIDDTHPQATLRALLAVMDVSRHTIKRWPYEDNETNEARRALAAEIMRPAATAGAWAHIDKNTALNSGAIMRADCETIQEEAQLIAALLRQALETPRKTAALITPDRALARRVSVACRRWNIVLDDSAGRKLGETDAAIFLHLVLRAALDKFAPGSLLALLRHRLCALQGPFDRLELEALRGPKPPPGIEGLRNRVHESKLKDNRAIEALINEVESSFAPLPHVGEKPFTAWLDAHIGTAERLAGGADNLWRGAEGEAVAQFLSTLRAQENDLPPVDAISYGAMLKQLFDTAQPVRTPGGVHPRLSIYGRLEARLIDADLIIMGGLNEGVWPPAAGHDPFLSRPMMKQFGLPSPERSNGLSAHDFVQGFCAPETIMTRAKRRDGAPTVPARWLQRLDTVLRASGIEPSTLQEPLLPLRTAIHALDENPVTTPASRPHPRPAVSRRPRRMPVTKIETWLRDPYSIYARYVLNLKKPGALEKQPDAADRGDLLHKTLERFITACPGDVPPNARDIILDIGYDLLNRRADDPGFWDFWWPRFERAAGWIAANEREWRRDAQPFKTEVKGTMTIAAPAGPFTLDVRADRIDILRTGSYALIDYKSGGSYSKGKIISGELPQLPLEALIVADGGFVDVPARAPGLLGYWVLSGGEKMGERIEVRDGIEDAMAAAREGLHSLITAFDDPTTPYYSLPDPDRPLRYNDYEQLARVQEWAALGEESEAT
jgi:ATP-dependent helicase/nuclease subunit B